MKDKIDIKYAFSLEPEKAVEYMQNKGFRITKDWREMWEDAHAKAFTISKMTDAELLKDTKGLLDNALKEGWSAQKTQREMTNMFKSRGWWGKQKIVDENGEEKEIQLGSPHRVRTIYKQNMQSAYNAGRYLQLLEDVDFAPYFVYNSMLDESTRPSHRALHGKVYRYDDPVWASIFPPNGWGCRCFVKSLSEREVERKGIKVERSGENLRYKDVIVNKDTGETKQVAVLTVEDLSGKVIDFSPDAGWSSNAGKAAWNLDVLAYDAVEGLSQELKDKFISEMAQNPIKNKVFSNFITSVQKDDYVSKGIECTAGWMTPDTIAYLNNIDRTPSTPVIALGDDKALHLSRDAKKANQKLTSQQLDNLSKIIQANDGVYWDETGKDGRILYIKYLDEPDGDGKDCIKVVVHPDFVKKKKVVNYIITSGRIKKTDLINKKIKKIE